MKSNKYTWIGHGQLSRLGKTCNLGIFIFLFPTHTGSLDIPLSAWAGASSRVSTLILILKATFLETIVNACSDRHTTEHGKYDVEL